MSKPPAAATFARLMKQHTALMVECVIALHNDESPEKIDAVIAQVEAWKPVFLAHYNDVELFQSFSTLLLTHIDAALHLATAQFRKDFDQADRAAARLRGSNVRAIAYNLATMATQGRFPFVEGVGFYYTIIQKAWEKHVECTIEYIHDIQMMPPVEFAKAEKRCLNDSVFLVGGLIDDLAESPTADAPYIDTLKSALL